MGNKIMKNQERAKKARKKIDLDSGSRAKRPCLER